ncbi:MAG: peptidylprolyl isomerase [Longimicrobiales bacterium]|nr:peptidylprolyl isomerase [Longimicrobiales bacterium]
MRTLTRSTLVPALLLLLACGRTDPVAFEVAGVEYTESELLGLPDDRRALLAELTAFAAVLADNETARLVEPWVDSAEVAWLWDQLQAERRIDSAEVSEAVLRSRYGMAPEFELTVRHLIVFSERYEPPAARAEARTKARAALERIVAGEPFPTVAAEVSDEPGAESRQGRLAPGRRGAWVSEFWAAASALEVGEVSGVTETQYGYHVLRLEGRDTVPFDEARAGVVREVATLMGPLDRPAPPPEVVRAAADSAGIHAPEALLDRLREQWVVDLRGQAELLGIPESLPHHRLKEVARAALSLRGQNADLARRAVSGWHDELARIHPLPETLSSAGS